MIGLSGLEHPTRDMGLIHLYTGDGKGKTTAAVGLCVRALGHGRRVLFCQFLKGRYTGELEPLGRLGAIITQAGCGEKFVFQMDESERLLLEKSCRECLETAAETAEYAQADIIVLDEVIDALNCGAVPLSDLIALISSRGKNVELVLTGRNPPPELCALADYHTGFECLSHPYKRGIQARKGVEY